MFRLLISVYPRLGAQHRAWKLDISKRGYREYIMV